MKSEKDFKIMTDKELEEYIKENGTEPLHGVDYVKTGRSMDKVLLAKQELERRKQDDTNRGKKD